MYAYMYEHKSAPVLPTYPLVQIPYFISYLKLNSSLFLFLNDVEKNAVSNSNDI